MASTELPYLRGSAAGNKGRPPPSKFATGSTYGHKQEHCLDNAMENKTNLEFNSSTANNHAVVLNVEVWPEVLEDYGSWMLAKCPIHRWKEGQSREAGRTSGKTAWNQSKKSPNIGSWIRKFLKIPKGIMQVLPLIPLLGLGLLLLQIWMTIFLKIEKQNSMVQENLIQMLTISQIMLLLLMLLILVPKIKEPPKEIVLRMIPTQVKPPPLLLGVDPLAAKKKPNSFWSLNPKPYHGPRD